MIIRSITKPNLFSIIDESCQDIHHGCNQEWYATEWQRRAGCGPSVASNLFYYLEGMDEDFNCKEKWLALMESVWEYVTPSTKGMPTTKMFYDSVLSFAQAKGVMIEYRCCEMPEDKSCRPTLPEIVRFIESGLRIDAPIAFLNLCNGEEETLYRWHWVTIISMEYEEDRSKVFLNILDEGKLKKIDLTLWHETTTLGGGFVYFIKQTAN